MGGWTQEHTSIYVVYKKKNSCTQYIWKSSSCYIIVCIVYSIPKFVPVFHIWYLPLPSYIPPFRTSEGAAFSTQVRVEIFRTKVNISKWKWEKIIRSLEGAEYSTQVSAPFPSTPEATRYGTAEFVRIKKSMEFSSGYFCLEVEESLFIWLLICTYTTLLTRPFDTKRGRTIYKTTLSSPNSKKQEDNQDSNSRRL